MNSKPLHWVVLAMIVMCFTWCRQTGQAKLVQGEIASTTEVSVDTVIRSYNSLQYGDKAEAVFKVTNTGNSPLVIKDVVTDCQCALGNWDKEPVMPGSAALIRLRYNYKTPGFFQRVATVYLNNKEGQISLVMRGKISR